MQKDNEWKLVQFEDRLESYFPDGSIIAKTQSSFTYYSTKGNKVKIGKDALKYSEDISDKMKKIALRLNRI